MRKVITTYNKYGQALLLLYHTFFLIHRTN